MTFEVSGDDVIVTPARNIAPQTQEPSEQQAESPAASSTANDTIDPATLPPELQSVYKSLEAGFTKKFMALAEERKKLEESGIAQQAQAFQRLTSDPEYRKAYLAALEANAPQQAQQTPRPWQAVKPAEVFDEQTYHGIQATTHEMLQEVLTPILQQFEHYRQIIDGLHSKTQVSEWDSIASKYSNASEFRDEALKLKQKAPGLSLEQALHAAAAGGLKAPASVEPAKAGQPQADKRQATMFPSSQASTGARPSAGKIDLLKAFRADLAKSGMSF